MHDVNGNKLKQGDTVLVPCKITSISPSSDYCNVSLETVHGRRPDERKEIISAINTGTMILLESAKE